MTPRVLRTCIYPAFAFMRSSAATKAVMRSVPAETGGSRSVGWMAKQSTSIWKTITEEGFDDQEAPKARLAAHAPWRTPARGDFAGAEPLEDRDREAARRVAPDPL